MNASPRLWTLASITLSLLAACGGHEEPAATAQAATTSTDTAPAAADAAAAEATENALLPSADAIGFNDGGSAMDGPPTDADTAAGTTERRARALATTTTTALVNSSFEGAFTAFAPGWWLNYWGTGAPKFEAARASGTGLVYAGTGSQRFRLLAPPAGGAAHLVYTYKFVAGTAYVNTMYLRADSPTQVAVQFRRDAPPWNLAAQQTLTLGTGWTQVVLSGTWKWSELGSIRIVPITLGTNIYLDEMRIASQTAATDGTSTPEASTNALALQAAGSAAAELLPLRSSSKDESYTTTAPGWRINSWGSAVAAASRETRADYVYSGTASQRFQLVAKNAGDAHLVQSYAFLPGKTYRTRLRVKAEVPQAVQVMMRRDEPPWDAFASRTLTAGPAWQTVEIEGTFPAAAAVSIRVAMASAAGAVWVDDVALSEVRANPMAPHTTLPIPDTLFGMHINKLGVHHQWPGMGTRIVRLWNTGTTWRDLEPTQDGWNWATGNGYRLDMYVNHVQSKAPGAEILYTLGQTPQWASTTPTVTGLYGAGASGAPRDMADWRDYVRTLARRYAGKIRYWELWNEPDYAPHWNAPMATLAQMARIAREELLAADPNNRLVSPGMTSDQGMRGLEQFLVAGGGDHVDAIGYHWYFHTQPEGLVPGIDNVHKLMANYGQQAKPLWNTEGAFICNPAVANCSTAYPTPAESRSVNARALFIMAAKGIGNYNPHTWEGIDNYSRFVEADFVTPTAAAAPYAEAVSWLRGARVLDGYVQDGKVYMVKLDRAGETAYLLWAPAGSITVSLPSAWAVSRVRTLGATESALPTTRQLTIGVEPVMLRP